MHLPPPEPAPDPLIGQQIGEFRVARMLAAGGMGAVYVLQHVLLPNTRKVLKVILPQHATNPIVRDRFLAEADALSQLGNHPSIVGIDSHLALPGGQLAILMPFCEGVSLDDYLTRHGGKLPAHRAFYVACHVARALYHAHARGIVHRDLKPSNVFVEDDDNDWLKCKLLDFGVARRLNPNPGMPTHTLSGPIGTPDYMPPEQQGQPAEATSAADVFSLAVMIWEMVTGGYPWGPQNDPAILYLRKLTTPPDPPVGNALSAEWERWLRAALRPDPAERPTLRQLIQGLARSLDGVGRLVPSGAEILRGIARSLWEESGPQDITLRNHANRTLLPAWPERERSAPAATPTFAHASQPGQPVQPAGTEAPDALARATPLPSGPALATAAVRAPAEVPRTSGPAAAVLALPAAAGESRGPAAPPATTIGASSGVISMGASSGVIASTRPAASGWKLAAISAAAIAVSGVGTFAIASLRGRPAVSSPAATMPPAAPMANQPPSIPPTTPPTTNRHEAPSTTAPDSPVPSMALRPTVEPTAAAAPRMPPATRAPSSPAAPPAHPAAEPPTASPAPVPLRDPRRDASVSPPPAADPRRGGAPADHVRAVTSRPPPARGPQNADAKHKAEGPVRKFDPNAAVGVEEE